MRSRRDKRGAEEEDTSLTLKVLYRRCMGYSPIHAVDWKASTDAMYKSLWASDAGPAKEVSQVLTRESITQFCSAVKNAQKLYATKHAPLDMCFVPGPSEAPTPTPNQTPTPKPSTHTQTFDSRSRPVLAIASFHA